jgi:hypothetical protein
MSAHSKDKSRIDATHYIIDEYSINITCTINILTLNFHLNSESIILPQVIKSQKFLQILTLKKCLYLNEFDLIPKYKLKVNLH